RVAVFNCRVDRPERSVQLGREFATWSPADFAVLMGTGTHLFVRAAVRAGYDASRLITAEQARADEVFERVIALVESSGMVMGMGNIGGPGLELVRHFSNRAIPRGASA
ncbi:poly-gamma-glutamate synthase PgsB, partial [Myxococcota bacterium]